MMRRCVLITLGLIALATFVSCSSKEAVEAQQRAQKAREEAEKFFAAFWDGSFSGLN
jgi:hypothetical protein